MKLVKKILRLLPLIYVFCLCLSILLNLNQANIEKTEMFSFWNLSNDFWYDYFDVNFGNLIFTDIYDWFTSNITDNNLIILPLGILFYELYLSIAFIFFDFINMIFSWANKLVNKGGNLDD